MHRLPLALAFALSITACTGETPAADAARPAGDGPPATADAAPLDDRAQPAPPDGARPTADQGPLPSGCDRAPGANDRAWKLDQPGRERTFHVHVPAGYDPSRPTPVLINFHGRGSTAAQQLLLSGMAALADREGFIAVHPEGVGQTWNAGICCGEAQSANVDDVGFARLIIDRLQAELCIDPRRVYAAGLSNGGFMSYRLACELADRIAAAASVAGPSGAWPCAPARPVPVFHFHGTGDKIVPYDGFAGQLSVAATMQGWVARNGCRATSKVYFEKDEVRCEEWAGCRDDASVRLCTIADGGHQWPGGFTIPLLGNNTSVISASQELWRFFAAHPRP